MAGAGGQKVAVLVLIVLTAVAGAQEPPSADRAKRLRDVDGIVVPPFGCTLRSARTGDFIWSGTFWGSYLATWPAASDNTSGKMPLSWGTWTGGPYRNPSGEAWVDRINAWYGEGTAAGLTQDRFRSYDDGHSSIRGGAYPQMSVMPARASIGRPRDTIFLPRVTMGVQSYGAKGNSVIDANSRAALRAFFSDREGSATFQRAYRPFYENNFLFVAPAVRTYKDEEDAFTFLSPFYLHSVGASGTDSKLLKPFIFASAALSPELKTRILRQGVFVPTLMALFKSSITGDMLDPAAHRPAYALPEEAGSEFQGNTPFLGAMVNGAHELEHIPPICRLRIESMAVETEEDYVYGDRVYFEDNTYAVAAALRRGQALVMTIDLRFSWTDDTRPLSAFHTIALAGNPGVEKLNAEGSRLRVRIPWRTTNNKTDLRTDLACIVHDGSYHSAPAYISVRHIHYLDPITRGIKIP